MNLIDVISAGPGGKALLTEEARKAVLNADAVFCAPRHADLVPDGQKRFLLTPFLPALDQLEEMAANGLRTAVLVSGDAGLYSLLPVLEKRFGRERLRVVPGVSSLAAFCARLGIPWQEAAILSAHGRALSPSALCHTVRTHTKTLFLLDGERDPAWVWRTLI